jgi:hypothetical protein
MYEIVVSSLEPIFSVVQGNQKLLEQHKRDFDGMSFTTDELS